MSQKFTEKYLEGIQGDKYILLYTGIFENLYFNLKHYIYMLSYGRWGYNWKNTNWFVKFNELNTNTYIETKLDNFKLKFYVHFSQKGSTLLI